MTTPAPSPPDRRHLRRAALALGALALGLTSLGLLAGGALDAGRVTTSLSAPAAVRSAEADDAYYACLDHEARSLVRPGQHVSLAGSNLDGWVTLGKVVGGWTDVTIEPVPGLIRLNLVTAAHGACQGQSVVALSPGRPLRTGVPPGGRSP